MFSRLFRRNQPLRIEVLLKESHYDSTKLGDLMKEFLVAKLYVKGFMKNDELFLSYEEDSLLAFTSKDALDKAKQESSQYILCAVGQILKMLPDGIRFLLNTGPNYGKEFLPGELSFLKEGQVSPDVVQSYKLEAGQRFVIFPARNYHQKLIDSLFECLKERENVERAYIAEIQSEGNAQSNLIIGILVSNQTQFSSDLGYIAEAARKVLNSGEFVDFIQLNSANPSSIEKSILAEVKPFFDRSYI
ncbi:MAG: enhanced serine sensitivity protein SseB C-terminal domain-containing protein [Candidatus Omnitrophica bacterium]|nr:enhanced serine sensitivity protein SseB C-terminal domain-containing protein [Candidatus Omnitrophota bacterium]